MRPVKLAIAAALQDQLTTLQLAASVHAVERATLPDLPAVEVIGVSSERVDNAMVRHELSLEVTVSAADEDTADARLSDLVQAIRRRVDEAENGLQPIALDSGENIVTELQTTRWSVSASGTGGVVRGAAVAMSCAVAE